MGLIDSFKRFFKRPSQTAPTIIARDRHCISRKLISKQALKVLYHLKKHGFEAYLVGGSVRDILLGVRPKDFDIATNAHPEQIKRIFYNCILIGKRFRIAHIRFPGEIIEVTTFRAAISNGDSRKLSANGMLLRDNVYGSLQEDVWRRDFSMNALYYNIQDFSIVDYCKGLEAIQNKRICIIGEAKKRYQEDPVRLLRAIRLAAKFPSFLFEKHTELGLLEYAPLLAEVPTSRLFEETLKLFHSGCAVLTYRLLKQYGLFQQLLPAIALVSNNEHSKWIETALKCTDQRVHNKQTLSPAFLFAALLWPAFKTERKQLIQKAVDKVLVSSTAFQTVISQQQQATMLTRFLSQMIKDIWLMQPSLVSCNPKRVNRLLAHPRFRAAYDFLLLRIQCGELPAAIGDWWTKIIETYH